MPILITFLKTDFLVLSCAGCICSCAQFLEIPWRHHESCDYLIPIKGDKRLGRSSHATQSCILFAFPERREKLREHLTGVRGRMLILFALSLSRLRQLL